MKRILDIILGLLVTLLYMALTTISFWFFSEIVWVNIVQLFIPEATVETFKFTAVLFGFIVTLFIFVKTMSSVINWSVNKISPSLLQSDDI